MLLSDRIWDEGEGHYVCTYSVQDRQPSITKIIRILTANFNYTQSGIKAARTGVPRRFRLGHVLRHNLCTMRLVFSLRIFIIALLHNNITSQRVTYIIIQVRIVGCTYLPPSVVKAKRTDKAEQSL